MGSNYFTVYWKNKKLNDFNDFITIQSRGFKKVWNPTILNGQDLLEFLINVKKCLDKIIEQKEKLVWSQEAVLEFLMSNHYDTERSLEMIRCGDKSFIAILKKYENKQDCEENEI